MTKDKAKNRRKTAMLKDPEAPRPGSPIPPRGVGSLAGLRNEIPLTAFGKTMGRGAWCRALGITRNALRHRLEHYPVEQALSPDFRAISTERNKAAGRWSVKRNLSPETREKLRQNIKRGKALAALRAKDRKYTANGETHTLVEWSKILGIKRGTLYARVKKPGADLSVALSNKAGNRRG
jgi:DNA-binding protein Fis